MTATASTEDKLAWLRSLPNGATNTANYKTQDFSQVVKQVTQNKGADVVIDFVCVFGIISSEPPGAESIFVFAAAKRISRRILHRLR